MSLYTKALEKFVFVNKARVPDGESGYITTWTDGAEFEAAATLNDSMVSKLAQAQGVTAVYKVYTKKIVTLEFNDVIKRKKDNKVFRIRSDGDDKKTPDSATLNMRVVAAEEWVIPND